jgi:hypothetical protein
LGLSRKALTIPLKKVSLYSNVEEPLGKKVKKLKKNDKVTSEGISQLSFLHFGKTETVASSFSGKTEHLTILCQVCFWCFR